MSLVLIQLVSEQTVQNLLPVLRLMPARLVHLATPRTTDRSAWIADAAGQAGCPVELETVAMSAMPSIREAYGATIAAIEHAARDAREVVVNFTGGTKLMSIGAHLAALQHKTPSLYVDTPDSLFIDGNTSAAMAERLGNDWSFTPLLRALTVEVVARANGCRSVSAGRDWRPLVPLARHLLDHPADEEAAHGTLHAPSGLVPGGREPRKPALWLPLLDQDFPLPPALLRLALDTGIIAPGRGPGTARLPQQSRGELEHLATRHVEDYLPRYFRAVAPLQQTISLLSGAWWEVIVADRAQACGRFRDLRWSVQAGELEEDLVALDGVQVAYVSCKRGGDRSRLLPLLDEIDARARTLGGTFTRRFLALHRPPSGKVLATLQARAKSLGIRLLIPSDLLRPDPFA